MMQWELAMWGDDPDDPDDLIPIGSMYGISWWNMLPYIAYMDPMGYVSENRPNIFSLNPLSKFMINGYQIVINCLYQWTLIAWFGSGKPYPILSFAIFWKPEKKPRKHDWVQKSKNWDYPLTRQPWDLSIES
jgi:hypothetical protein